jgi:hypothetical protein
MLPQESSLMAMGRVTSLASSSNVVKRASPF